MKELGKWHSDFQPSLVEDCFLAYEFPVLVVCYQWDGVASSAFEKAFRKEMQMRVAGSPARVHAVGRPAEHGRRCSVGCSWSVSSWKTLSWVGPVVSESTMSAMRTKRFLLQVCPRLQ